MILYIVGGVLLIALGVVAYILYRGYKKIKPEPIGGIPIPPLTHSLLGHPDKMLSPLKHELRLEVTETANSPYHQLVMMKHASIFINDSFEAARVLNTLPSKGPIYEAFRYNKAIPDTLASDSTAWELRSQHLSTAFRNLDITNSSIQSILTQFETKLATYSTQEDPINLLEFMTLLSLDIVCKVVFDYNLNALNGSQEGNNLNKCLVLLAEQQANSGIYANPKARKISESEIKEATSDWRAFLMKIQKFLIQNSHDYKSKYGELTPETNYGHALIHLSEINKEFTENEMICEIHQILRHGHETIAGTLMWSFYALFKHEEIRAKLETELSAAAASSTDTVPVYLQNFIKEVFRRYPTAGNMTVRTVNRDDYKMSKGHPVPQGTPIHIHMWSLQNGTRDWAKSREFDPDRWAVEDKKVKVDKLSKEALMDENTGMDKGPEYGYPKCPFLSSLSQYKTDATKELDPVYEGVGFSDGTLCYFPFSAGPRSCPAKALSVSAIEIVLSYILTRYRIDPPKKFWEVDPGQSVNATIIPLYEPSKNVKITKASNLGIVPAKKDDEGWADDDDTTATAKPIATTNPSTTTTTTNTATNTTNTANTTNSTTTTMSKSISQNSLSGMNPRRTSGSIVSDHGTWRDHEDIDYEKIELEDTTSSPATSN